jgi:hypothetical protein
LRTPVVEATVELRGVQSARGCPRAVCATLDVGERCVAAPLFGDVDACDVETHWGSGSVLVCDEVALGDVRCGRAAQGAPVRLSDWATGDRVVLSPGDVAHLHTASGRLVLYRAVTAIDGHAEALDESCPAEAPSCPADLVVERVVEDVVSVAATGEAVCVVVSDGSLGCWLWGNARGWEDDDDF